jgi:RNA polymerase sigma-70 factor (ECF subfamily)
MPDKISETEFGRIIYENQELIFKVCSIYCQNQSDKDDLFQEITINLWRGLPSFKGNSKLSTWIYRVSLNTAISQNRKKRKINFVGFENAESIKNSTGIEQEFNEQSSIKILYSAIAKLKPVEKAIVLLYLEEKSYEEIASIIGISKSNVSVKLVRLKQKLEKILTPLLNE